MEVADWRFITDGPICFAADKGKICNVVLPGPNSCFLEPPSETGLTCRYILRSRFWLASSIYFSAHWCSCKHMSERDANKKALRQVEKATNSDPVKGKDLQESAELKRQLSKAEERYRSGLSPKKAKSESR